MMYIKVMDSYNEEYIRRQIIKQKKRKMRRRRIISSLLAILIVGGLGFGAGKLIGSKAYDIYNKVINELGLTALNTEVPDSKRFRREGDTEDKRPLFRSTMFPSDRTLIKGSCIRELTDEILDIIKL